MTVFWLGAVSAVAAVFAVFCGFQRFCVRFFPKDKNRCVRRVRFLRLQRFLAVLSAVFAVFTSGFSGLQISGLILSLSQWCKTSWVQ